MITIEPTRFEAELSAPTLTRFLNRARAAIGLRGAVDVLVTTDKTLRQLNRSFRGKDKPTDVLSSPHPKPSQKNTPATSPSPSKPPPARPKPSPTPSPTRSRFSSSMASSTSPAKITKLTKAKWQPAKPLSAANFASP